MDTCELREEATVIAGKIADQFGYTLERLKEKGNSTHLSNARNIAYYILHYDYGVSLNELAEMFGRTNREVCYRIAKLREKHDKEPAFRKRCEFIKSKLT